MLLWVSNSNLSRCSAKMAANVPFKVFLIAKVYFSPFFGPCTDFVSKTLFTLQCDPHFGPVPDFLIPWKVLVCQVMLHWPKLVKIVVGNVWKIPRTGFGISLLLFWIRSGHFESVEQPGLDVLQNRFVLPLAILRSLDVQCSAQTHYLRRVQFTCSSFALSDSLLCTTLSLSQKTQSMILEP